MFEWIGGGPTDPKNIGVPFCGGCHPGGGGLEFDRDGKRYDQRLKAGTCPGAIPRRRLL